MLHRLAGLDWVAVVLSPLMVLLMEAFWVYPWLAWVGKWPSLGWQRPPLSLVSLILLLVAAFSVTRWLTTRRWSLRWIRLSIIASGLVAIFLVVRIEYGAGLGLLDGRWFVVMARVLLDSFSHLHPEVIALAAGVYLWWRGMRWGRSPFYFGDVYRSFLIGLVALVLLIVVWGVGWGDNPIRNLISSVGLYVVGFFFCALTALALTNLQAIQEEVKEKEGAALVFSRRWLPIIVGVIGGIVLVGIGIASIFSADFVTFLGHLLNLASDLLLKAVYYLIVIPVGYLVWGLDYILRFIVSLFQTNQASLPSFSANMTEMERLPQAASKALSPEAILAIKWAFFSLVAAGVLFLLARAIFRYRSYRGEDEVDEISESLWSWGGFLADLRLFFSLLRQRFRRKSKEVRPPAPVPAQEWWGDVPGRLGIREIYQRLLWQASQLRIIRQRQETPYEYAGRLGQAVPEGSAQLRELTGLYVNVRYGDLAIGAKEVDHANSLWRVLRELLQRDESR
jgi:hypothetical protein